MTTTLRATHLSELAHRRKLSCDVPVSVLQRSVLFPSSACFIPACIVLVPDSEQMMNRTRGSFPRLAALGLVSPVFWPAGAGDAKRARLLNERAGNRWRSSESAVLLLLLPPTFPRSVAQQDGGGAMALTHCLSPRWSGPFFSDRPSFVAPSPPSPEGALHRRRTFVYVVALLTAPPLPERRSEDKSEARVLQPCSGAAD